LIMPLLLLKIKKYDYIEGQYLGVLE